MTDKDKHIPQGYKDSPLGIIPKEWEVKKLGDLCKKIGSGVTPRGGQNVYLSKGRPFMRSQNVANGNLILDDIVYIDEKTHQKQKSTEIELDDILLNITGASIGRCAVATQEIVGGNVNQHVCIIRLKDVSFSYYINTFLLSYLGQKQIDSYQAGGNREGLNYDHIASFKICIPSSIEIMRLNIILQLWDTAIEKQSELIEKLKLRKRALMQQLLTGNKRLSGFSGEWKEVKLGDIGEMFKGSGVPKDSIIEAGHKCLTYGDIYTKYDYVISNVKSYINDDTASKSTKIQYGDICFAGSGETKEDIGKCAAFIDAQYGYAGGDIIIFRAKKSNPITLSYILNSDSVIRQKSNMGQGHSVVHIYPYQLEKLRFKLPPKVEQDIIASILMDADKEIELAKEKLSYFQSQKRGLMQQLLTGKKRISS